MTKSYPINQSPLFRLSNKRRLAELLKISSPGKLLQLVENGKYKKIHKNGKTFTPPVGALRRVHDRTQSLLSRLELPEYLHSGRRGRSNVTNALAHYRNGSQFGMVKTDIGSFFRSTPRTRVKEFFNRDMECSNDIAEILADLLTHQDAIPKGSPCSTALAFWVNKRMFDEINDIVKSANASMTLYVDDLTITMKGLNRNLLRRANSLIRRNEYTHHKHRIYKGSQNKVVTGVVLVGSKLRATKNIYHSALKDTRHNSWSGRASYIRYIHNAKRLLE